MEVHFFQFNVTLLPTGYTLDIEVHRLFDLNNDELFASLTAPKSTLDITLP
jgi:hypothetical protein